MEKVSAFWVVSFREPREQTPRCLVCFGMILIFVGNCQGDLLRSVVFRNSGKASSCVLHLITIGHSASKRDDFTQKLNYELVVLGGKKETQNGEHLFLRVNFSVKFTDYFREFLWQN